MRTRIYAVLTLAATLTIAGCASDADDPDVGANGSPEVAVEPEPGPAVDSEILAAQGIEGLDVRGVIDTLDTVTLGERSTSFIASIRPNELYLTDEEGLEESVPMPDDSFYVSFAPFINQTHPCHFHSLTTCVGELQNVDIHVLVTDNTSGETLLDEDVTTYDNGFYGIWLPRDLDDVTLTVEYDGMTAQTPISTSGDEDATCVTEPLQLS